VKRFIAKHGKGILVNCRKGDHIFIKTVGGGQVSDLTFLGFDQAMARNFNGWRRYNAPKLVTSLEEGDALVDGNVNPVLRIVKKKSSVGMDVIFPGCWSEIYDDHRPGCRDILSKLFGVERKQLPAMATLFMEVRELEILPCRAAPGDYGELEALRDVVIGVTSCPDDEKCNTKPGEIEVTVDRA
jgi:uncharacterized protein YcgI (DUF1989 family)